MAKYKLTQRAYIDDVLYEPDDVIIFSGTPGFHMEPINELAKKAVAKAPKGGPESIFGDILPENPKAPPPKVLTGRDAKRGETAQLVTEGAEGGEGPEGVEGADGGKDGKIFE